MVQNGKLAAWAFALLTQLNKVLLPTLGRPTIPHFKPMLLGIRSSYRKTGGKSTPDPGHGPSGGNQGRHMYGAPPNFHVRIYGSVSGANASPATATRALHRPENHGPPTFLLVLAPAPDEGIDTSWRGKAKAIGQHAPNGQ